jgi:hypothetical protein
VTTYFVDSYQQGLRATGIVEPLMSWVEDPATGRRKQSSQQDHNEDGQLLWSVEVTYVGESFGRQSTVVSKVIVPADRQPAVSAFDLITFDGLSVTVSVNRSTGQLREFWRALGMDKTASQASSKATAAA